MAELKDEVRDLLSARGVSSMKLRPVRRNYAFENPDVAHGAQWVLKVKYPAAAAQMPVGTTGACGHRLIVRTAGFYRQAVRQTDRQTDRQADRQTEILVPIRQTINACAHQKGLIHKNMRVSIRQRSRTSTAAL
jgi:hypothetical protein